ncbi:MAG: biotin--[acetyl-CoA-carboxylase] ligase [Actinomycetes bacterium]
MAPAEGSRWGDLQRPPLRHTPLRRALVAPAGQFAALDLLDACPSTNTELAARAAAGGVADLSVLTTDDQTAGRGRLDRTWTTPPRSALATSVLLRPGPDVPVLKWSWLPLLAGVAIVEALRAVAGLPAVLKWPNDVLVPDGPDAASAPPGKVCGVLSQVVWTPEGEAVVLGFGLNVSQTRAELAVPAATSLLLAGSATTDRDTLLRACLRALAGWYLRWTAAAGDAVRCGLAAAARDVCCSIGQRVRVELPAGAEPLSGVAEGLDDDGRLLVRVDPDVAAAHSARTVPVAAGDVVHLRPSEPAREPLEDDR